MRLAASALGISMRNIEFHVHEDSLSANIGGNCCLYPDSVSPYDFKSRGDAFKLMLPEKVRLSQFGEENAQLWTRPGLVESFPSHMRHF